MNADEQECTGDENIESPAPHKHRFRAVHSNGTRDAKSDLPTMLHASEGANTAGAPQATLLAPNRR